MALKSRLLDDLTSAMKAGQAETVGVLRMVKAEILKKEVSLRKERGRDYELDDPEVLQVLGTYAKQRRQSIEAYEQGGRKDLQEKEERELAILDQYLPRTLSDEELTDIVVGAIEETGATEMRDMGAVMKAVMSKAQGRADGKQVSEMVREKLSQ